MDKLFNGPTPTFTGNSFTPKFKMAAGNRK